MIIAIDGPAASGKGTLARQIADHYQLHYLDTGALYRAVGWQVLARKQDPRDETAAIAAARDLDIGKLDDAELRSAGAGEAASIVAAMPAVRAEILNLQRRFAEQPPGAVLDGRDIGTVVCPDADVKLFVVADLETRAERRWLELQARGAAASKAEVLDMIKTRDQRDQTRDTAPLVKADDAHLLDTSKLDIEAAFQAAVEIIDRSL